MCSPTSSGQRTHSYWKATSEKFGLTVDYLNKRMMWPNQEWEPIAMGDRGEYLLHLGKDISHCLGRDSDVVLMPEDANEHIKMKPVISVLEWLVQPTHLIMSRSWRQASSAPRPKTRAVLCRRSSTKTPRDRTSPEKRGHHDPEL